MMDINQASRAWGRVEDAFRERIEGHVRRPQPPQNGVTKVDALIGRLSQLTRDAFLEGYQLGGDVLEDVIIELHDALKRSRDFGQHKGGCGFLDKGVECDCGYADSEDDAMQVQARARRTLVP